VAQRRSLIALLILGSVAAIVSCGGTDAAPPGTSSTAAVSGAGTDGGTGSTGDEDEDGGVPEHHGHGRLHARALLVRGGTATFIGLSPREIRCIRDQALGSRGCPGTINFSGSVIIEGATFSVLGRRHHVDGDGGTVGEGDGGTVGEGDGGTVGEGDGGTVGEPDGGTTGGPIDAHQGVIRAEHSHLVVPQTESGDAGVPGTTPDGGVTGEISARLHGGRIVVVLGTSSAGDGGVVEDGGVTGGGGSLTLRHIRDVRFEGSVVRFVPGPTHDPDAG
jgi:hypothetical protein